MHIKLQEANYSSISTKVRMFKLKRHCAKCSNINHIFWRIIYISFK